jgi:hypothetical protein
MSEAIYPPGTATKNHEVYVTDDGDPARCVICADAAPWNCNECNENVCERHVAFVHHDCEVACGAHIAPEATRG